MLLLVYIFFALNLKYQKSTYITFVQYGSVLIVPLTIFYSDLFVGFVCLRSQFLHAKRQMTPTICLHDIFDDVLCYKLNIILSSIKIIWIKFGFNHLESNNRFIRHLFEYLHVSIHLLS